jgi:hypothetical protein
VRQVRQGGDGPEDLLRTADEEGLSGGYPPIHNYPQSENRTV